jgi:ubiquinone/menaquinone biosynthesis C-methylase UbiE
VADRPRRAERPGPRTEGLSPREAATVYDRIGRLQDTQRVFEAPALARLSADGRLADARAVVEIGCGTGRFARALLTDVCHAECRYTGLDVSPRMCRIASAKLSPWPHRAQVMCYDGTVPLPLPAACADRVVAAFLIDLLPTRYGRELLADAHRILTADGLLCLASLTHGTTPGSRAFSTAWSSLARRAPALVGGCRPVVLADLLEPGRWAVRTDAIVTRWGFPAEILVATRQE